MVEYLRQLPLQIFPESEWEPPIEEEVYFNIAEHLVTHVTQTSYCQKVVQASNPEESNRVEQIKMELLEEYKNTVFRNKFGGLPPKRGPHGQATFQLKPDAEPKTIRPFTLVGERREAMNKMISQLEEEGKIEQGVSEWTSPAFHVPKKNKGEYRLVIDYRYTNDCTKGDSYPLPKIWGDLAKAMNIQNLVSVGYERWISSGPSQN